MRERDRRHRREERGQRSERRLLGFSDLGLGANAEVGLVQRVDLVALAQDGLDLAARALDGEVVAGLGQDHLDPTGR